MTPIPMTAELKKKWIEDLRSGKYKQGNLKLKTTTYPDDVDIEGFTQDTFNAFVEATPINERNM